MGWGGVGQGGVWRSRMEGERMEGLEVGVGGVSLLLDAACVHYCCL